VDEIIQPVDANGNYTRAAGSAFGPEAITWSYSAPNPTDFYALNVSGAQRLPNGNTLICDGPHGIFFEVTSGKEVVWKYINPVVASGSLTQGDPIPTGQAGQENHVFRAYRYAPNYAGLAGKNLTPGDPIEKYPTTAVDESAAKAPVNFQLHQNYPNPFSPHGRETLGNSATTIRFSLPAREHAILKIFDVSGRELKTLAAGEHLVVFDATNLPGSVYFHQIQTAWFSQTRKAVLRR
jgi:hypothetical protein